MISLFEAHFGRKANTTLSIILTEPDLNTLTYKPILNKYLDTEKVRWVELITEDQWDNEAREEQWEKGEINSVRTQQKSAMRTQTKNRA